MIPQQKTKYMPAMHSISTIQKLSCDRKGLYGINSQQ